MQFTECRYLTWYQAITARAQKRRLEPHTYTERHHIIPRSLGGSNEPANLARLTAREHFIAHWLLTKFTEGQDKKKMVLALFAMTRSSKNQQRVAVGARQYARVREAVSEALTGEGNPRFGVKIPEEQIQRAVESRKQTMAGRGPYKHSNEVKERIAATKRGKPRPEWIKEILRKNLAKSPNGHNKGRKWFNNGVKNVRAFECPEGFSPGRLL